MKNQEDLEQLLKLIDKYEQSLQQCTLQEFRELRYQLKQVKEKLSSLKKQYGNGEVATHSASQVHN
jgi:hypothetical protein